jgi:hypothetical protein
MIYLDKSTTNTFVLTLTESTTISNPTFLFKFVWELDESLTPIYWVGTDTSAYTYRYNLFTLEEGVDATFKIGQYRYEVFESVTPITVDENTTEVGLTKIEEGRMVVDGTGTTIYD